MLLSSTPGVVLNALYGLGFECTDAERSRAFFQVEHRGNVVKVEVLHHALDIPIEETWDYQPPVGLTSPLAWLTHELSKVHCFFDPKLSNTETQTAVFIKQDKIKDPLLGLMTNRVTVRATFERAPAA